MSCRTRTDIDIDDCDENGQNRQSKVTSATAITMARQSAEESEDYLIANIKTTMVEEEAFAITQGEGLEARGLRRET